MDGLWRESCCNEDILYPLSMLSLKLDNVVFDCSTTGKLILELLGQCFQVNVLGVDAFDHRILLTKFFLDNANGNLLTFLCYGLTNTEFLGQTAS